MESVTSIKEELLNVKDLLYEPVKLQIPTEFVTVQIIKQEFLNVEDHPFQPDKLEFPAVILPDTEVKAELLDVTEEASLAHDLVLDGHAVDEFITNNENIETRDWSSEDPLSILEKQSGCDSAGLVEFLIINESETSDKDRSGIETEHKTWSHNHTKVLIDCYKKYRNSVGTSEMRSMKRLWERIAKELNEMLKINVTPAHCENRWRVIERNYKKYIDNNSKTGRPRKIFEYASEMNDIFHKKRNIQPEVLLSSNTMDHVNLGSTNSENGDVIFQKDNLLRTNAPEPSNRLSSQIASKQGKRKLIADILESIRKYKLMCHKERMKMQKEHFKRRMEMERKKLEEKKRWNDLMEERNKLLQQIVDKSVPIDKC